MRISIGKAAVLAVVSMFAGAVALTACSPSQQDAPEPQPSDIINGTQTKVIQMPDGFRNLSFTCHGTVGLYVTSRGWAQASADKNIVPLPSSVTAVPGHPLCTKG